ncbi:MAG: ABC transporter permease [Acidobacteria bacterium]|nr:ABC transporter permease [Acidobacteriota bacterium]
MRSFWKDVRFGLRFLWSKPGFAAAGVLTLAIGIATAATVFSWVDELLLNPFPGSADSSRLAVLENTTASAPRGGVQISYPDYRDYRDNLKLVSGLAIHHEDVFGLGDASGVQPVWGELGAYDLPSFRARGSRLYRAIARLGAGAVFEQARAEAMSVARGLEAAWPDSDRGIGATILPAWQMHGGAPELLLAPLRILMAVSLSVLLIACANVSNLLLARSMSRQGELGIRLALGAGRVRLMRQLLTETLLLAGAGAFAALPLAALIDRLHAGRVPKVGVPVAIGFHLGARTLAFTMLACVFATLVCGVAPVLFSFRTDLGEVLKQAGRTGAPGAHSRRLGGLLVAAEVALAAVALIGAGLFVRSFQNARNIYPGFDKTNVLLSRFYFRSLGYSADDVQQFCIRLRERLRSAPGIREVNYADFAPLGSPGGPYLDALAEGYVPAQGERMDVNRTLVAPGQFSLLRIPLLEGRDFTENDDSKAAPVLIVNEAFERRYFGGANPVGRKARCWGKWVTVVGLVKNTRYYSLVDPPGPHLYVPFRQQYNGNDVYFFIKTSGDPGQALGLLRREIAAIDPGAGAYYATPLAEYAEVTLFGQKIAASLLTGLGFISLLLAGMGLYSVMTYTVSRRTHEFGIRMSLGAQPGNILADVLRHALTLTLAGLAVGIAAALCAARLVSSLFVNVGAADPVTFMAVPFFLTGIALLAACLPARRAARVNPAIALRFQ